MERLDHLTRIQPIPGRLRSSGNERVLDSAVLDGHDACAPNIARDVLRYALGAQVFREQRGTRFGLVRVEPASHGAQRRQRLGEDQADDGSQHGCSSVGLGFGPPCVRLLGGRFARRRRRGARVRLSSATASDVPKPPFY
eukprot:4319079-Prymnesium_polylepis.1